MEVGGAACLLETLGTLLERGHDLASVLPAFTCNPGAHWQLARTPGPQALTKGKLVVGADADLVILNDKHRAEHVMAGGHWLVRDRQALVRGTFEKQDD